MKKIKLFLIFSMVIILTLPTIPAYALNVDVNAEEKSSTFETETNQGRNTGTWISNTGIIYYYNTETLTGAVTGYTGGDRSHLVVESTITVRNQTITIDTIGDEAFRNSQVGAFHLPNTITTIGNRAFAHNRTMHSIDIPNSVTTIGNQAFDSNTALTQVNLSTSLTTIGASSFALCRLHTIHIPNSVTSIGQFAFANNRLTTATLSNSLTSIGNYAFTHNQLANITLPNTLTSIGISAFANNQLSTVTLPNSLTSIENHTFWNNRLSTVILPDSLTSIGSHAFANNYLQHITLPISLLSIESNAFRNNSLTSIEIPRSVTTIGNEAFHTNHLSNIFIPNSVTSIGRMTFANNPLEIIQTDDGNTTHLKSLLAAMGDFNIASILLLESSTNRYNSDLEIVNNMYPGNTLELQAIPQLKYIYNTSTSTWLEHIPVVQWFHNGNAMTGQNNTTLILSNIQKSDAGEYHAIIDNTVLANITVNVTKVYPLSELFPDQNLAKAIAEELHGNPDTSVVTTKEELATIRNLNANNKGIQDLTGIQYLTDVVTLNLNDNQIQDISLLTTLHRLQFLLLNNNQISNISPLSALSNLLILETNKQIISLPETFRGEPTELHLINRDGSTPSFTFIEGAGSYDNGQLVWHTSGQNQLAWSGPQFSGTVTQNVTGSASPIHTFFPDENLAKAIAEELYGNPDTSVVTSEEELAKITMLFINNRNIKDLSGIEHLKNLSVLSAAENHINDIRIVSTLSNLIIYNFGNQSITLPEGLRGEPTELPLLNKDGSTPTITFIQGEGNYSDGQVTWHTAGENQFTWSSPQFSGTATQNVRGIASPIHAFFPDENLAKAIAEKLYGNPDTSAITTEEELSKIDTLLINNRNIKDLSGIEHLKNLSILNASENHIHDIRILSKLSNLTFYNITNQTITLPDVEVETATPLAILDANGITPNTTFTVGMGHYDNGQLIWHTTGENRLTWGSGTFSGTVIQQVHLSLGMTISSIFPDENLAKAIAEELYGNPDSSVITTREELAKIDMLLINNRNIKNLSGIEHLTNLSILNAPGNHIHDISILSKLPNLTFYSFGNQTITLPEVEVGTATPLALLDANGETPSITFTAGMGHYENGQLTWRTVGENQFTWGSGAFSGTATQQVQPSLGEAISTIFPDENLAKAIAEEIYSHQDTSALITDEQLLTIRRLDVQQRGIKDLTGIERLSNLQALNASNNHIQDISMLSHLPNLIMLMAFDQVITLPEGIVGVPTRFTLMNEQGLVPNVTFSVGQGTYVDGQLLWTTHGENQLTWNSYSILGTFSGTVIQHVESSITTIADMFPDENFARTIAEKLHGNPNTNVPVTKQELTGIMDLVVPNRNIRSIAGIENLQNLIFFSAEDNQISDISMLSQLPNLVIFNLTKQVITLPNVPIGTPTSFTLLNDKGVVPHYTFIVGQGTFHNNELIWNTVGQNQMHWTENSQSIGFFDGVIIQNAF